MRALGFFLCLCGLLAWGGGCNRSAGTSVTVTLRIDREIFRPDFVLLSWRTGDGRDLFRDVRVPAQGNLAREGAVLGSVAIAIEADTMGDRELEVSGLRAQERVAGARARIAWQAGHEQQVTLTLGCVDHLEQAESVAACAETDPEGPPPAPTDAGAQPVRDAIERPPEPPHSDARSADARADAPGRDAGTNDAAPDLSGTRDADAAPPPSDARDATVPDTRDAAPDRRSPQPHPAPAGVDLARGLLLYLPMNEGTPSLVTRDGSGRLNQATLVGLDQSAWIDGPLGNPALAFPAAGTPGWVRVDSSPALNEIQEGFTIAVWIRAAAAGGDARRTIAARRAVGPGGYLYSLHLIGDRPGLYIHSNNGAHANLVSPVALPPGTWVHLALVYDRLSARLLVDGQLIAQQPYQLTIGPENSPLSVGASADVIPTGATDPLGGDLGELVVYDHALGDAEISALATGAQPPLR